MSDVKTTFFEQKSVNHDGSRMGILHTRRGDVKTPTFMPDGTRGVVKSLTAEQVKSTGVDIVLANTYHLHLQPGEKVVQKLGGLHEFGKWQGPILTDSGGFQVFSLSKLRKITEEGVTFKHPVTGEMRLLTPETSMQIQLALGSDMIVAFDHLTGLDETSIKDTHEAFERTHRWLERCITEYNRLTADMPPEERPILFGVVQGGLDKNLRKKSLEIVQASGVAGIAIGGLSVGESKEEMYKILEHLAPLYDDSGRPRFLLGVGAPPDIRYAIEHGIDMLDCVLPTRNARHATVWVEGDKKLHLTNAQYIEDAGPIDESCDCYTCKSGYSKGFLRHQFKVSEPLAGSLCSIHNLRYLQRICEGYRD
ncbi:tRNA guanosine(34) transglycosylase Tgt [Candidatus Saccharibacteria bacterium]|nr:tRNA guanosine(34) transglycosylase Tgt [Candidatus Saccharibacteria bacterium]